MGAHIHSVAHSPFPGGETPVELPEEAPSRAYLKLEESLHWAGNPVRTGDTAVEIGSAPGGASYALLKRGLRVVGIDPGEMAGKVLRHPDFIHFQKPVAMVPREELPDCVEWLFLDMNVEPRISLFAVDRLVTRLKSSLLGVILTLKLNRWKIADEIPSMLEHVRVMGMVRVKAAQLSHNRQEIVIFGLTRKGLHRAGSNSS
jgi:23S rRNA (cytidine2498-2'-O)-methyltransferase